MVALLTVVYFRLKKICKVVECNFFIVDDVMLRDIRKKEYQYTVRICKLVRFFFSNKLYTFRNKSIFTTHRVAKN